MRELWDDRYPASAHRFAEKELCMGLRRGTISALDQAANELKGSRTTGVAQASSNRGELVHRTVTVSKQLLDDGGVVFAAESGGVPGSPG